MGQREVLEWFREKRLGGVDDFFSVKDLEASFTCSKLRRHINRLVLSGVLEVEYEGLWRRRFRIKKSYLADDDVSPCKVAANYGFQGFIHK